ncbi:MAG: hypothetical protein M3T49_11070 [Candidatus Eremiobacteraeota bacterium]|nr:hypothetical protein [Candidatus Eremiobacteraeota bacterium]
MGRKRIPADMLLIHHRRSKLERDVAPAEPVEIVDAEDDRLVDEQDGRRGGPPDVGGARALTLYRPLGQLNLGALAWSGRIDQRALMLAIACGPVAIEAAPAGLEAHWFEWMRPLWLARPPQPEPALIVDLISHDLDAIDRAAQSSPSAAAALSLAAALPVGIIGTESPARSAARGVLTAYRNASMLQAWRQVLRKPADTHIDGEHHGAAVALLSTLRALLGEA